MTFFDHFCVLFGPWNVSDVKEGVNSKGYSIFRASAGDLENSAVSTIQTYVPILIYKMLKILNRERYSDRLSLLRTKVFYSILAII